MDMFKNDPNVVAIGPYISCEINKHIQSFMIVLDGRGLEVLEKIWRCPCLNENRGGWIRDTEVVRLIFFLIHFKWRLNSNNLHTETGQ